MGYGKRALQQLAAYYSGDIPCLEEAMSEDEDGQTDGRDESLHTESIVPRYVVLRCV